MNKNRVLKAMLTLGPIGYFPASGTCASLITMPLAFLFVRTLSLPWYALVLLVGIALSCACIHFCRYQFSKKDPSEIVIDEVFGCLLACCALPSLWWAWVLAFVVFRVGDISKWGIIGAAEKLPGCWGIMLDDLVAGILSNFSVHLIIYGVKIYRAIS